MRKINEEHSMTVGIANNIQRRIIFIKDNGLIPSDDEISKIVDTINKQLDDSNNDNPLNGLFRIDYTALNKELLKISNEQALYSTYSSILRRYIYHVIANNGSYDFANGDHIELCDYINDSETYERYYSDHPELSIEKCLSSTFFDVFKDYTRKNGFVGKEFNKRPIQNQLFGLYTTGSNTIEENTNYGKKASSVFFHAFITKIAFFLNLNEYNLCYFLENIFPDNIPLKLDEFLSVELIKKGINCKLSYDIVSNASSHETNGEKTTSVITEQVISELRGKEGRHPRILFEKLMKDLDINSKTGLNTTDLYNDYISLIESTMEKHNDLYSKLKALFQQEVNTDLLVINNEYNDNIDKDKIDSKFVDELNEIYSGYCGALLFYDKDYFGNRLERNFSDVIEHSVYIKRKDIIMYQFIMYSIAIDTHMIKINADSSKYINVQLEDQELYIRAYKSRFIENTNKELIRLGYPPLSLRRQFDSLIILSILNESEDPRSGVDKDEKETPFKFLSEQMGWVARTN